MTTAEIRNNFHNLIDNISNEVLLIRFYDLMLKSHHSKKGTLWSRLSKKEQKELLLSEEESRNPENLIDHDEMAKKHKKWL